MNILPNAYLPASAAASQATSASSSSSLALLKMQQEGTSFIIRPSSSVITSSTSITPTEMGPPPSTECCAVCDEPLDLNAHPTYQMLAVRPSICTPPGTPFFPFFEKSHPNAMRLPCCSHCSASLLEQWNEHEGANVPIGRRAYAVRPKTSSIPISGGRLLIQQTLESHSQAASSSSPLCLVAPQQQHKDGNESTVPETPPETNQNRNTGSSPQNEVLDLSMPSAPLSSGRLSPEKLSRSGSCASAANSNGGSAREKVATTSSSSHHGNISATVPQATAKRIMAQTLVAQAIPSSHPNSNQLQTSQLQQQLTGGTRSSLESGPSTSLGNQSTTTGPSVALPYFNSSMTNLIKVTSNAVPGASPTLLKLSSAQAQTSLPSSFSALQSVTDHSASNNHLFTSHAHQTLLGASSSGVSKKVAPLFLCSLCDETCTQLVPIPLRPLANCPHFPTLINYVKTPQIDSSGRINVCENCNRQLLQQWELYQKQGKPVLERFYQLIKPSKPNQVLSFSVNPNLDTGNSLPANSLLRSNLSGGVLPSSSASSASSSSSISLTNGIQQVSAISKSLFTCILCGMDLLFAAATKMTGNSSSSTADQNSHLAFSLLTEPREQHRKLLLNSALEFSLLPFMPNSNTSSSALQPQLSALLESGRVLCCYGCFENVSRSSNLPVNINNSTSNTVVYLTESTSKPVSGRSNLNGNHIGGQRSTSPEETPQSDEPCHACGLNKAIFWVETKETASKEAYFPFLRNPADPEGRTHLCGACHLILETQWDAYEAILAPQSQRDYQFPQNHPFNHGQQLNRPSSSSSSNGHTFSNNHHHHHPHHPLHNHLHGNSSQLLQLSRRNSSSHSLGADRSSPLIVNHSFGGVGAQMVISSSRQSTPPPLKIQISSPSGMVMTDRTTPQLENSNNNNLLLTTVNAVALNQNDPNSNDPNRSSCVDNELIFHTINEFVAKLGGPHSHISGNCVICNEFNKPGEGYQIFSSSQKMIISPELGQLPFFPMLKKVTGSTKKLKTDSSHVTCVYCYHSLIAQWAAYHVSAFPEDRDPSMRIYNCRDFICFVCGVTTYRSLVRSISVKDFPFLIDHKRPPGSLSLHRGEQVITCLNCCDTLTHQWIENERMKVPLEMRQYNWMPVPQQLPPPSQQGGTSTSEAGTTANLHSEHSSTRSLAILNHNGIPSGTALTLVTGKPTSSYQSQITSNPSPIVTFNPSHTLAPLVAAAMAAAPVICKADGNGTSSNVGTEVDPGTSSSSSNSLVSQSVPANSTSFADALRSLARKHVNASFPAVLRSDVASLSTVTAPTASNVGSLNHNHVSSGNQQLLHANQHSFNLSTLASVAALAGSAGGHQGHHHQLSTDTSTPNSHTYVLNLATLQDGIVHQNQQSHNNRHLHHQNNHHQLGHHHDQQGQKFFITTPDHLMNSSGEGGRLNGGRYMLSTGSGSSALIQFSGTGGPFSQHRGGKDHQSPANHHHNHGHIHGTNILHHNLHHHPHPHHQSPSAQGVVAGKAVQQRSHSTGTKRNSSGLAVLTRQQLLQVTAGDNAEKSSPNRTLKVEEVSPYERVISAVDVLEMKRRNKRLARQQQKQQMIRRLKRARLEMDQQANNNSCSETHDSSSVDPNLMVEVELADESRRNSYGTLNGDYEENGEEEGDSNLSDDVSEEGSSLANGDADSAASMLHFVESVLRPLPLDESPEKMNFFDVLGLTTKKIQRSQMLEKYVTRKVHHRVSHVSFKLALAEEESVLEKENDDHLVRIECSSLLPTDDRLAIEGQEESPEAKASFVQTLHLLPVADNEELVLRRELSWLAVVQERAILRRRRGFRPYSIRPVFNNLSSSVLNEWLPKLTEGCRSKGRQIKDGEVKSEDDDDQVDGDIDYREVGVQPSSERSIDCLKKIGFLEEKQEENEEECEEEKMEIDESEVMSKEQSISYDSSDGQQEVQQHSQLVQVQPQPQPIVVNNLSKTTSRPTKGNRSCKKNNNSVVLNGDTENSQHLPPPLSLHLQANLGEASAQQTPSSAPPAQQPQLMAHLPTNKIINSKQFAQEFHDTVLQETREKQMKKQQLAGDKNGGPHAKNGFLGQKQFQLHQQQTLNAQTGFNQSITFNDSQHRPNTELNHNFSTERTTPSSAPPVPCSGSVFKFPEKISVSIRKVQQRLAQILQETQYLNEKKNEIDTALSRLEQDRSNCEAEMERLATLLDGSIV